MRMLRSLALATFVLGFAASASANTIWVLNDVTFVGPGCPTACLDNAATGSFVVDSTLTSLLSWDITVTGTDSTANHHFLSGAAGEGDILFPSLTEVAFFGGGFNPFLNLALASPLSNGGGPISLLTGDGSSGATSSVACPGCGLGSGSIIGTPTSAVPEPATLSLLGLGLVGLGARMRRTRKT